MRVSTISSVLSDRRRLRARLALTSALGGLLAGPALAQTLPAPRLPTRADVVSTNPDGLLTAPDVRSANGRLDVTLNARNTVIDWNGFNIPENNRADFAAGTLVRTGPVAVLNRDVSGNVSQLLGRLTSDANVAVWVYNPTGILVGGKAAFATGSLVLTTLNPDEADFRAGGRDYRLTATAAAGQSAITVLNGAQIRVEGGNRGLVMVAPKIDADGSFQAIGQDVAFVTAADVTLSYANNGPLSVTLRQGTAVPGRSQYVRGSVAGDDALFALASQGTITDALLQVDASVTTATAGTRGIVLSAGRPATAVAGVTVLPDPADTGGVASLLVGGALASNDTDGSDIRAGASGAARFMGALSSGRDVLLAASGPLDVANTVSAVRAYSLAGGGIGLGPATAAQPNIVQSAASIAITATDGDIVGRDGLALRTGGTGAVTLSTAGGAAGNILFAPDTLVQAGANRGGALTLRVRDAGNLVTLGDVSAQSLRGATGTGTATNGLALTNALVVGDVDVRDAMSLTAGGIDAGTLASDGGVNLVSAAGLSTAAITARGGSAVLTGGTNVTATGTVTARGNNADITVSAPGTLALTGLSATRDVRVGGSGTATATITGPVAADRAYTVTAATIGLGAGTAVTQSASGAVTITGGVGGITAATGTTLRSNGDGVGSEALTLAIDPAAAGQGGGAITFAPGTTLLGGSAQQSDVQVRSADAAGTVTLDRVSARNLLGAVGADAFSTGITRTGAITVGAVTTRGDLLLTGHGIDAGALTSSGVVTLDGGTGGLAVGNVDAAGAIALRGGALSLRGTQLTGTGAIDLLARTGGIASTGALAITSTSTRAADFVRVQAAGADGIVFAPGSTVTAGTDRALRVAVFNGSVGAPLAIGDVTARSLGSLAALNGDATARGGAITQGGSLAFGTLDLVDGFAAESSGGDLSVARIAVTGAGQGIDLRAAGTLRVQNSLSASGDVTLASGTALRLSTVESRDGRASVTSGGAVTLEGLAGATGTQAQGASLAIDRVVGGTVSLVATTGDATLGTITGTSVSAGAAGGTLRLSGVDATRDVGLSANGALVASGVIRTSGGGIAASAAAGAVTLAGGTQASGDVVVTGRSVSLGGAQQAGGAFTARATAGDLVGPGAVTILSDADGTGGEALTLAATGDLTLGAGSTLRGGGNRTAAVTITAGRAVDVGSVDAARLSVIGADGAIQTIRTGNLTVTNDVVLTATARLATGTISTSAGAVSVDGGSGATAVGDVTAAGDVALAGGTLSFGRIDGGSLAGRAAAGTLVGGDVAVRGAVTLAASGTVRAGAIGAGGAVSMTGADLAFGAVSADSLSARAMSGNLTGGDVTTVGTTGVTVAGTVDLGRIDARQGSVTAEAGGRMALAGVTAGGGATLRTTGSNADILVRGGVAATDAIIVAATGSIRAPFIRSSAGDLTVAAPDGEVTGFDPGTDIDLSAGPGRAFSLTVGTAARLGDIAGGRIAITATSISAGRIDAGSEAIALRATNGDLVVRGPVVAGMATLEATGRTSLADITASGAVMLAGGTELSFDNVGGGSIGATSGGSITGGAVRATGSLEIVGGAVSLRTVGGQGVVTLRATNGNLTVTGPVTGGGVTLDATGRTDLADVTASGALSLDGGAGVRFGEIAGALITATSAGTITGNTARTSGSLAITGAGVSLRDVSGQAVTIRATSGDLNLSTLAATSDAALSATALARITGAVATGGAYRVTGASVALGGGDVAQRAAGEARITATTGDIVGAAGLTLASDADASAGAEPLILDAAGGIALAGTRLQARPGGGATLGLRAGSGRGVRLGIVEAGLIGGFDGTRIRASFAHDADVTVGDVAAGEMAVSLSAGNIATGRIAASGALSLRAATGTVTTGDLSVAGLDLTSAGALTTGTIDARGVATLTGGSIVLGNTRASALTIRTAETLGGQNGTQPSLTTTAGDLSIESGTTRLGEVRSAGAATLSARTLEISGRLTAARALLVRAREALTLGDASAGADMTVEAGGAVTAAALEAGGALSATGVGVTAGSARAGGRLALTSSRDLSLGGGTAAGGIAIDTAGTATLGALSGGPSVTVTALDAALSGPVRAMGVTFANKATTGTMRLGDDAGDGGFRLSAAEIGQVAADAVRFDAGSGLLAIGSLALAPTTGRVVDLVSTGTIRVTGGVSASGTGRTIRLGGGDVNAATIHIVPTSAAGGRLMADGTDLELRADRIAVGLGPGFIDTLGQGDAGKTQATSLIGNANSALYNPQFGGGFYEPGTATVIQARSLSVRFADYALFQNTALPGQSSGLVVGGTQAAPVMPALRVATTGSPATASFALFGTVNGVDGASAALLGNGILDIDPLLLPNTRINGCLAGSGAGCLTTIVIQPTLQVFDFDSQDVFGISQDVAVPFAPVVGGNNEELLSDLPELIPAAPAAAPLTVRPEGRP